MDHRIEKRTMDEGVSESIGFLLIFTMVIVGIGLVTLYGYPMLIQQQTSADKQIMQKNMIVLQNDMKSLSYKTVPYKETALNIGGGTLTVYNSSAPQSTSEMRIYDTTLGVEYLPAYHSGDLRYTSVSAGTDISLQNGAVVMRDLVQPGSVMLAQPRWFYDAQTNTMVINLISLNSSAALSRAGVGTVQMTMGETSYEVFPLVANTVCLEYTPDATAPSPQDYSVAWDTYFNRTMNMMPGGDCPVPTDYQLPINNLKPGTLVIKKYDVVIKSL
jgi:hypothetical protein